MEHITEEQLYDIPEERAEFLPPQYAEDSEKRRLLLEVVEKLRPNYRVAVMLYYFEGLSYAQITQVTGASTQMINHYLQRARKKIREELEKSAHGKFENVFAAAPVPVLTQAMRIRANELISPAEAEHLVQTARLAGAGHAAKMPVTARVCAAMAAGVAAVALVVGLAQANITGSILTSPLSSSAAAVSGVPQPLEDQSAAEGGLEINETTSPMAGQIPQAGPAGGAGTDGTTQIGKGITGALVLKDAEGNVATGAEKYLSGITIKLLDGEGEPLAAAVTDEMGRFAFRESAEDGQTVKVETADTQIWPAEENPEGTCPAAGQDGQVLLYVQKVSDPQVEIEFTGGECGCGHVNPKQARAVFADEMDKAQHWEIVDEAGTVAARGDTETIGGEVLRALAEGKYTINWTVRDAAGNTGVAKRVFRVVAGAVEPGMYA